MAFTLRYLLAELGDLAMPRRCVGCGRDGAALCCGCAAAPAPADITLGPLRVCAAAEYSGAIRLALLHYKERGRRDLCSPLAALLASALRRHAPGGPRRLIAADCAVLVPVPSRRAAAVARGGDHLLRLTRRAGALTGLRMAPTALALVREVDDSAGLGAAERAHNFDGAMSGRDVGRGRRVVLVDDIVTSGATLTEARRALAQAGSQVIGAAVVAATPLHPAGRAISPSGRQPALPERGRWPTGTRRGGGSSVKVT